MHRARGSGDIVAKWQCNICGSTQKRRRSRSKSRAEDEDQDRPTKAHPDQEATNGDKGKGRGKRPGGPFWISGGPQFQRECPNLGKGGPPYPITTAWTSQEVFQDRPSTMELLASQATLWKLRGKEQKSRKRKKWRQVKGKG